MNLYALIQGFYLCELAEIARDLSSTIWPDLLIPSNALEGVDAVSEQPGNAKEYASMSVLREKLLQAIRSQSGFDLS